MLYEQLKTKRNLVLYESDYFKYVLYSLNKEEAESLEVSLSIDELGEFVSMTTNDNKCDFISLICMGGHIKDVKEKDCYFIPIFKVHGIKIKEYCCYSKEKDNIFNNVKIHEDALSSFKCACEKIQTTYFIVLKENKYDRNMQSGNT